MEPAALLVPAVSAPAGAASKSWPARAWGQYALALALAAMPLLHPVLGINPVYAVFVLAVLLDALSGPRIAMVALLASLPVAVHLDLMGWVGWCLLLPRLRWFSDAPMRASAMICLWFGVYLRRGSGLEAWAFCGIFGYCMLVLDSLPRRQGIRTAFSMPILLQLAVAVSSFAVLDVSPTERYWFAVNPNIDGIIVGALLTIAGCELLGLGSAALLFTSRSALLSVLIRLAPIRPSRVHLALLSMVPFLVATAIEFLPRASEVPEGPARLFAVHDDSNEHRRASLVSAISWLGENPESLTGSDDRAKSVYLFYNGLFPHNAFVYAILDKGLLVFAAFALFTWSAYDRLGRAGRLMVLSLLAGVGFSDIGFDFPFVIAILAAGQLMDWRAPTTLDQESVRDAHKIR